MNNIKELPYRELVKQLIEFENLVPTHDIEEFIEYFMNNDYYTQVTQLSEAANEFKFNKEESYL